MPSLHCKGMARGPRVHRATAVHVSTHASSFFNDIKSVIIKVAYTYPRLHSAVVTKSKAVAYNSSYITILILSLHVLNEPMTIMRK
jgi:hypothetical protein